jgi:RNA polymerase sigma factor (sigma-70 family)
MTTTLSKRQLAAQRLDETITHLWSRYAEEPSNKEIRNRLAEHYTPLVQHITRKLIPSFGLRDRQSAIGDALLLLVMQIIPHYDRQSDFRAWATHCLRTKMAERKRLEDLHNVHFARNMGAEEDWPGIETMLVRPQEPGSEGRFAELMAALPARDGAVLWLRYCRHLRLDEIAAAFDVGKTVICKQIRRSIAVLKKLCDPPEDRKSAKPRKAPRRDES